MLSLPSDGRSSRCFSVFLSTRHGNILFFTFVSLEKLEILSDERFSENSFCLLMLSWRFADIVAPLVHFAGSLRNYASHNVRAISDNMMTITLAIETGTLLQTWHKKDVFSA